MRSQRFRAGLTLGVLFTLGLWLVGCAQLNPTFVGSERAEYKAVKPYLVDSANGIAHPQDAAGINDNLTSWDQKLSAAEKSVGASTPATTQP